MNKKDREFAKKYLDSQILMGLSTLGSNGSLWSANVYFAVDDDLNFYFMSSSDTEHCENIKSNPKVSMTVVDSTQDPSGEKIGMQISGECNHVYNISDIKSLLRVWNKKFSSIPAPPLREIKIDSPFYKVKPSRIKFYNTEIYPKDKFKEWTL